MASAPLPSEFDAGLYRARYADLQQMSDAELADHFDTYGSDEGRCASTVQGRQDFFGLIPGIARTLEIGPFNNPAVRTPSTQYFDTLSAQDLRSRARQIGIDDANIPDIHWVDSNGDLSVVTEKFDICVSSHAIEHQPDLVRHLVDVERLLVLGGRYFLAVPDRRFTFDHFLKESNIAEVLDAHEERRRIHTLRSVIEHRALTTHNDAAAHWQGLHGDPICDHKRVQLALEEYESTSGYIDVHAWIFTFRTFRTVVETLTSLGLINLRLERLYPTLYGSNEFYAVLTRTSVE